MQESADRLVIWQQNVNRSPACQHTLLSNKILVKHKIGIVALQEPVINPFNNSIASKDWILVYPTPHCTHPVKTRALTLIRSTYSTDTWEQIDFPSGDVVIICLKGVWGKIIIFNIYNDGKHNNTIEQLKQFHNTWTDLLEHSEVGGTHTLWLGNFNRHHPHWDDPNNTRLFTAEALKAAEVLIEELVSIGLELALPSEIPTHCHSVTKKWSRLDHVFISDHSTDLLISCNTETRFHSIKTDHLPVVTKLSLSITSSEPSAFRNFCDVDWTDFRDNLSKRLATLDSPKHIKDQDQLNVSCDLLTRALQMTIEDCVPTTMICTMTKRWWTRELTLQATQILPLHL